MYCRIGPAHADLRAAAPGRGRSCISDYQHLASAACREIDPVTSQAGQMPVGAHHRSRTSRHLSPIPTASPLQKFFLPALFFWETHLPFLWTLTILPHMRLENRHPDVLAGSTLHRRLARTANGRGISDGAYPGPIRGGVPCLEPRPRKQGQPSYRHRLFPALGAHRGSVVRTRPPG
jgi:hypothetical protein